MSQKQQKPFAFLYSKDSDTNSASECEITSETKPKRVKMSSDNSQVDVEILKVEPGPTNRVIEIVKVEWPPTQSPDVEIVKVVPGTSTQSSRQSITRQWPIQCKKIEVQGCVGKPNNQGML